MDWATCTADYDYTGSTKNYTSGRGGNSIDRIVIHHNAGNLTFAGVLNAFNGNGTSAHYDVRGTEVAQYVYDSDTAYHAGNYSVNQKSIGIEHCNNVTGSPWTVSDETLDTGAHLVAALCVLYGLGEPTWGKNVYGHNEVKSTSCPGALMEGGSQHDEYMTKAKAYYAAMTTEEEDMTSEQAAQLAAIYEQVTSTSDPSGRGVAMNDHDHLKWIASKQSDMKEKLDEVYSQVTKTDDPSGREVAMNDHDHLKWIAAKQAAQDEKLDLIMAHLGITTEEEADEAE